MINYGSLVISLDYELMWGMHDVATKDGYGMTNIQHVPEAIDRMLELFRRYGVHATFATVGMIMYDNKEELMKDLPDNYPSYYIQACSPYGKLISGIQPSEAHLFFQKSVVEKLRDTKGIEVATHTYCHYYCWEEGQTIEQFDADIKKAVEVAKRNGMEIKSIVFPRNNVSKDYLTVCAKYGITSYRGNALKFFDEPLNSPKQRICRLLDNYLPLAGYTSIPYSKIEISNGMVDLKASRLLRPYSRKLAFLDCLRLRRIKKEMVYAAKHNEMYHIWWHPHNFGADIDQNIAFLEKVLKCYNKCNEKYGMMSYTMKELSDKIA